MSFQLSDHIDSQLYALPYPAKKNYAHTINLSSNEINHPALPQLFAAFLRECPPNAASCYPYWPQIVTTIARHYGLDERSVVPTAGADDAIRVVLYMLGRRTRRLVLQSPNYQAYTLYARLFDIAVTPISCVNTSATAFIDELIEHLSTAEASLVVLTNPHGFTGQLVPADEMERLARTCARHNHLLAIDETYIAFSAGDHLPLMQRYEHVLLIRSFSKGLGMAGLRMGAILASPALASVLARWSSTNTVTAVSGYFLAYCFEHHQVIQAALKDLTETKAWLVERLGALFPEWRCELSATNFLLVDTGSAETADHIVQSLAERAIMVKSLAGERGLETCFRFSIGERRIMETFLATLEAVCSARAL
ncbi:MAG TPA: aminotransferase class I/II-fold pyridoxal phosphate-dependent enzyme [Herpetosiphonaceae bacterium]